MRGHNGGPPRSTALSSSMTKLVLLLISTLSSLSSHPLGQALHILKHDDPDEPPGSSRFWWKLGISVLLILGGGVFAGLTIGLMGQDIINVWVITCKNVRLTMKVASISRIWRR